MRVGGVETTKERNGREFTERKNVCVCVFVRVWLCQLQYLQCVCVVLKWWCCSHTFFSHRVISYNSLFLITSFCLWVQYIKCYLNIFSFLFVWVCSEMCACLLFCFWKMIIIRTGESKWKEKKCAIEKSLSYAYEFFFLSLSFSIFVSRYIVSPWR